MNYTFVSVVKQFVVLEMLIEYSFSYFNNVCSQQTPYQWGTTDSNILKHCKISSVFSRAINHCSKLKIITDNIMQLVIMKSHGVCKVLMGLWSFISLGPGVSTTQACASLCSWKILPLASVLYFSITVSQVSFVLFQ